MGENQFLNFLHNHSPIILYKNNELQKSEVIFFNVFLLIALNMVNAGYSRLTR
jgi:hypothetical protein